MAVDTRPGEMNENGVVYVEPKYVLRSQVSEIVTTHGGKWKQTPQRAENSRALTNGDIQAPIPKNFKIAGADQFRVDAPHKYMVPYYQRAQASSNPPRVKRWPWSEAQDDKLESTKIEQILQSVMDDRYKFRDSVDILLMESVCISVNTAATDSLSRTPSLWETDQKTIKPRYARNKDGKPRPDKKDPEYTAWRVSKKASKKLNDADVRDTLSKRIPSDNQLLGPTEFIPVFGPGLVLDAVVIERNWTVTEIMRRELVIDGLTGQMSPDGSAQNGVSSGMTNAGGKPVKVTELHAVDYQADGPHPYIAYMADVGNGRTPIRRRDRATGETVDYIVDLREKYGLTQFHVALAWGQNWAHPDYDKKGMPFPLPFAQSWLAIDAILTGATVWSWWRGFPTLIEQPSANTPPEIETITDSPDDDDDDILEPLTIIRAKGNIVELGTQGPAQVIQWLVTFLVGANREQAPNDGVTGDASSGFQASLQMAYSEKAMADVRDGSIALYKQTTSIQAEILAGIAERYCTDKKLPIQRITPVPLGSRTKDGSRRREILDLTPAMFGEKFDFDAEFPPVPNLAKGSQWAEWVQLGLVLLEEFRTEIIGDEHPEVFIARRLKQRIMDSPQYMDKIVQIIAQLEGGEQERQQMTALASGQGERGTDGVVRPAVLGQMLPSGLPGNPPAPTGAGGPPDPGQMALAGIVGGPVGAATKAAAAGGAVPQNVQLG